MRDLRCFTDFPNGRSIDKVLTLEYKTKIGRTQALTSANIMFAALDAFLCFASWLDCQVKQFKIQKKAFRSEEKELSKAEYLSLVRTAENKNNERISLPIQTICGTGIRVSKLQYIFIYSKRENSLFDL